MRASPPLAVVLFVACAAPESERKDTSGAVVQQAVDSLSKGAESGAHAATGGVSGDRSPIIERHQRDSAGRPLPRPGATQTGTTRMPDRTKRDTVIEPGPPQPSDPKRPDERHPDR